MFLLISSHISLVPHNYIKCKYAEELQQKLIPSFPEIYEYVYFKKRY